MAFLCIAPGNVRKDIGIWSIMEWNAQSCTNWDYLGSYNYSSEDLHGIRVVVYSAKLLQAQRHLYCGYRVENQLYVGS